MAGYNNWIALANFLLISSLFAVCVVSWEEPSITVKKGENIDITCTVKVSDEFDVVMVQKKGEGTTHYTLAERSVIQEPFAETKRYRSEFTYDDEKKTGKLRLHITDIVGADSGELGCLNKGSKSVKYVEVIVKEPVDEVYFMQWKKKPENEERINGQLIHLRQGRTGGLSCVALVKGPSPDPEMTVTVDDEDKTDSFELIPTEIIPQGTGALVEKVKQVKLSMTMTDPPTEWHDKEIVCEAKLPDYPAEFTRARIEVKFRPEITCEKYQYYAKKGEAVTIKCTVQAHPQPSYTWEGGMGLMGSNDQSTQSEKKITKGKWEASLHIAQVQEGHFSDITLTADNGVEPAKTVTIILEEIAINNQGQGDGPAHKIETPPTTQRLVVEVVTEVPLKPKQEVKANPKTGQSTGDGGGAAALLPSFILIFVTILLTASWRS